MDITSINDGKFAVIKTSKSFILVIDEEIFDPFVNTKRNVKRIYQILKNPQIKEPNFK